MGNLISPCMMIQNNQNHLISSSSSTKLIVSERNTRIFTRKSSKEIILAGEIMFEFPDKLVCHADSFFIGQPIPALSMNDVLLKGQTYLILPIDFFPSKVLSVSSISSLIASSLSPKKPVLPSPFEYLKGKNGTVLVKVVPEFIMRLISNSRGNFSDEMGNDSSGFLCSTPELKKQYDQLVGCSKVHVWSPKLETISEHNKSSRIIKYSPCRVFRLGIEAKR